MCTRIEHVGLRYVVRIVLPVPLLPFARYLVAQESAHEHAESALVWESEWRHFPPRPALLSFSRENKTRIQWYRDNRAWRAFGHAVLRKREFANCARKIPETPMRPEEAWCILAFHGISHFRLTNLLAFFVASRFYWADLDGNLNIYYCFYST